MNWSRNYAKFDVTSADEKQRLRNYLDNLSRKRDSVEYDSKVVDLLMPYCRSPQTAKRILKLMLKRGYAQSRKDPTQLDEQIDRFKAKHVDSKIMNPNYRAALEFVRKHLPSNLEPLEYHSDEDIIKVLPRKDTHAGFTYIYSGGKLKGDNLENVFAKYKQKLEAALSKGTMNVPSLIGVRTQNSSPFTFDGILKQGENFPPYSKTRMIIMDDMFSVIIGLMYAKPLQDALGKFGWYAGGKSPLELRAEVERVANCGNQWYSIDYSSFDSHIPGWLIRDAFTLLKSCFRIVDEDVWNLIVHDFVNKTLIRPNGECVVVHDGIPSGNIFTQIIGSLCNAIMLTTYLFSEGHSIFRMITMGDDNLFGTVKPIDVQHLSHYMRKMFGSDINWKKVETGKRGNPPRFLSREWRKKGEWRHPSVLLVKLAYPERKRNYEESSSPEDVIYSYCLSFPLGMNELIDMPRFINDYQPSIKQYLSDTNAKNLSGLQKYNLLYSHQSWEDIATLQISVKAA